LIKPHGKDFDLIEWRNSVDKGEPEIRGKTIGGRGPLEADEMERKNLLIKPVEKALRTPLEKKGDEAWRIPGDQNVSGCRRPEIVEQNIPPGRKHSIEQEYSICVSRNRKIVDKPLWNKGTKP
jgi:hypothetical protein